MAKNKKEINQALKYEILSIVQGAEENILWIIYDFVKSFKKK